MNDQVAGNQMSPEPAMIVTAEPQAVAPQVVEKPKKSKKRMFLILGIIILILVLVGVGSGAYYLGTKRVSPSPTPVLMVEPTPTASPDPMAGWEMYENDEYRYKFTYPSTATVEETNYTGYLQTTTLTLDKDNFVDVYFMVSGSKNNTANYTPTTINGYPAMRWSYEGGQNPPSEFVIFERDKLFYRIQLNYSGDENELSLFDQILESFEFVDQGSESSGLNVYRNTTYGYSISFPKTWKAYNVAAGGSTSEASAGSLIVDISDTTQASRPYPNGVITIQGFDTMPSYDSSWTKSLTNINSAAVTIFEKADAQDGPSVVYIFQSSPGAKYMEVMFRSSKQDSIYKTFSEIVSTFKFTQ